MCKAICTTFLHFYYVPDCFPFPWIILPKDQALGQKVAASSKKSQKLQRVPFLLETTQSPTAQASSCWVDKI